QDIKRSWAAICQKAKLGHWVQKTDNKGKPVVDQHGKPQLNWKSNARIHDMRNTYASHLVSGGQSLALFGGLLGHTQASTALRYAHLALDPPREASERVGTMFNSLATGKAAGAVTQIPKTSKR